MGFGREGVHREKKVNHSKEIRLAEKAECSWQVSVPVGEEVCQQSSPAKGEVWWQGEQRRNALGPSPPPPACPSAIWRMSAWTGARGATSHGEGHAVSSTASVGSGQTACGRCYRHACSLMEKDTPETGHLAHCAHTPRAQRHIPQSLSNFQTP